MEHSTRISDRIVPPLKWHGGKNYLARKIVELMPSHIHYVEPYAGGLAVLLAKNPEGFSEVVNDLNGNLCNFWNVLRDTTLFESFLRMTHATPFSEQVWLDCYEALQGNTEGTSVERAFWFFVTCRQSLAGRMDTFAPLSKTRTRRNMNEQASAWLNAVQGLPLVHSRLKRVAVLNKPALDVLAQEDGTRTLFYCDPPYLHETRTDRDTYQHEMSEEEHQNLLTTLLAVKGKVILSGYHSTLYDTSLRKWNFHDFELPNNAASGGKKRRMIEAVWCNF
jgi:DNA adenine methylase